MLPDFDPQLSVLLEWRTKMDDARYCKEHKIAYPAGGICPACKMVSSVWDVSTRELPGWTQTGDIHGNKYAIWVQHEDGSNRSIQRADNAENYWLIIDNCVHGSFSTPELAAKTAAETT